MSVFDLLRRIADELPGCILTSVVSMDDGLPLATVTVADNEDAAAADAFHSDVYRTVGRALRELGVQSQVQGFVLQGEQTTYVSLPLGSGFFWHIATRSDTTLGFTQALMRRHRDQISQSVSELFQSV